MKVKELKEICQKLRPGLDKQKSLIEQFKHICFTGNNLITYNERVCIAYPFETNFQCSVIGYDFIDIINSLPQNADVHLRLVKNKLRIRGSDVSVKISTFENNVITEAYKGIFDNELDWKSLPTDFLSAINFCHFSVSSDLTRPYLNYIKVSDSFAISSDNLRISRYEMDSSVNCTFFIPGVVCKSLLLYDIKDFTIFEPWIGFSTIDGVQFFCRTANVEYPDLSGLFDFDGENFELPSGLKEIVESLKKITEEEFLTDRYMVVTIGGGKVSCFVEKATVSANRWLDTDISQEFTFVINPVFFNDILDKTSTIKVSPTRALFTTDKFDHLLSLPIKGEED